MLVVGLDFEATGLDTSKDRITEIGAVLWDWESKTPVKMMSTFVTQETAISEENSKLTGIKNEWLSKYGISLDGALFDLSRFIALSDGYVFAHNGSNYDQPLLAAEIARTELSPGDKQVLSSVHWVDTRQDLPFLEEPESRRLKHLALDAGFINPFEHRAVFDVCTMMRVASDYPLDKIIEQSRVPWVIARALVGYDDRQKAKDARFSWEALGDKVFPKMWVKKIRENHFEKEAQAANERGFKVVKIG